MIDKNSLIPQFESIVSDIKNTTCEIQEFKKSIELCKLVFLNSNLKILLLLKKDCLSSSKRLLATIELISIIIILSRS